MARTIAPGTPTPIEPLDVNVPDIDLSVFDQYGDYKIKSAIQNFQLYATTTANAEAQKAYQRYKNNPIALANALTKLPAMFNDLPKSVQAELRPKLDSNAISLVTKAQANQQAAINKQNKALAQANAVLNMNQLSDDYFNVLRYITSPDEEKRPVDMAIYKAHRAELERLTNITDEDGKPIFSESQRAKMMMPKDATVAGFKQFVNRMESDQLKEWDEKYFQNQEKFMADTGIDADTYDSMETYLIKRAKALKDTKVRTLHGQAYYDATNLITEPTQLNIEKAKAYPFMDNKAKTAIDKLAETAKKTTAGKYYAPETPTSPTAFLQAYTAVGDLIKNTPDDMSAEQHANIIAATTEAMEQLNWIAESTNMEPDNVDKIKSALQKALTDKQAKKLLVEADFANRITPYMAFIEPRKPIEDKEGISEVAKATNKVNNLLGIGSQLERRAQFDRTRLYQRDLTQAEKDAARQYNNDLTNAMMYYLYGNADQFLQASAKADRNFDKKLASNIVKTELEWQRLEKELEEGKPAMVNYLGRNLEFKGFNNKGAIFQERN